MLALRVVLQMCKEQGIPVDTADETSSVLQQHTMFAVSDFYYLATSVGRLKLERGQIDQLKSDGVVTKCGKHLAADMVCVQLLQWIPNRCCIGTQVHWVR